VGGRDRASPSYAEIQLLLLLGGGGKGGGEREWQPIAFGGGGGVGYRVREGFDNYLPRMLRGYCSFERGGRGETSSSS